MLLYDVFYYAGDGTPLLGFDSCRPAPAQAPSGEYAFCVCVNWDRSSFWLDDAGEISESPAAVFDRHQQRLSDADWAFQYLTEEHFSDAKLAPLWLAEVRRSVNSRPADVKKIREMVQAGKKVTLYQRGT